MYFVSLEVTNMFWIQLGFTYLKWTMKTIDEIAEYVQS